MVQSFIIDCFKERKNEKQAINHVLFSPQSLCTVPWAVCLGISRKLFRYFASFHTVGVVYLWLWYIDILSSHYVFIFLYSHIYNIVNIYSEYSYKMNVGFIFKPVSRVTRAMYITFLKKKKNLSEVLCIMNVKATIWNELSNGSSSLSLWKLWGGCVEEIALVFYTWQIELQQQICIITIQRPGFLLGVG